MAVLTGSKIAKRMKVAPHEHMLKPENALDVMLGGHAKFTIVDLHERVRFTYKLERPNDGRKVPIPGTKNWFLDNHDGRNYLRFCKVLTGPDNWSNYSYFACIKVLGKNCEYNAKDSTFKYEFSTKAKVGRESKSVKLFELVMAHLRKGNLPTERFEIWNSCGCGRCGLPLTDPESIEIGLGPWCRSIIARKHNDN